MSIKDRIKQRRKELGLSQVQLATAVSRLEGSTSVLTRATVAQWEAGTTAPKHKRLQHVAEALQTTVAELLGSPEDAAAADDLAAASPWPIRSISANRYAQLPRSTQEQIEAFICTIMGMPPPIDWRTTARNLAADVDRLLKSEHHTEFVNAVDKHHDELAAEARRRHAASQQAPSRNTQKT